VHRSGIGKHHHALFIQHVSSRKDHRQFTVSYLFAVSQIEQIGAGTRDTRVKQRQVEMLIFRPHSRYIDILAHLQQHQLNIARRAQFLIQLLQFGHFLTARRAPRPPKMQQHHLAAQRRELERLARRILDRQIVKALAAMLAHRCTSRLGPGFIRPPQFRPGLGIEHHLIIQRIQYALLLGKFPARLQRFLSGQRCGRLVRLPRPGPTRRNGKCAVQGLLQKNTIAFAPRTPGMRHCHGVAKSGGNGRGHAS
jgi:hypothetical protein